MHITCEGKAYELFEGATPQNLWNMVSRGRDPETAVLADSGRQRKREEGKQQ